MDDYVIFAKTRHKLKAAIKRMYAVLDNLQLTLHPDKRYIGKTEKGFDFLGYRFKQVTWYVRRSSGSIFGG